MKSMMLSKFMMNQKEFIISIMVMVTMKKWNVLIIIMKNKNKGSHGLGRQKDGIECLAKKFKTHL